MLLFFRTDRQGRLAVSCGPGWRLRFHAKRKAGQAIENKQLREMVHFAPPMISRTYDQRRETARFARRKESFAFAGFSASSTPKTQGSEINGGFAGSRRTSRESATRNWRRKPLESLKMDSEIAPPVPTAGRENRSANPYETFCTQPETGVGFFYFFARNPLKSPDSDE